MNRELSTQIEKSFQDAISHYVERYGQPKEIRTRGNCEGHSFVREVIFEEGMITFKLEEDQTWSRL